jgi:hypothetical protein
VTAGGRIQCHHCLLTIDVEPHDAGAPVDLLSTGRRLHHDSRVRINPLDLKLSSDHQRFVRGEVRETLERDLLLREQGRPRVRAEKVVLVGSELTQFSHHHVVVNH